MSVDSATTAKKKCFVISPIGAKDSPERKAADQVLRHLIRKALDKQYDVERADDSNNPGEITTAMVASILEADLIVADLTGHNPNVFYEIAMAHGYNKPTVHIQRAGDKVPFDVKDMRVIPYDMGDPDELELAQKTLREFAKFVVENPGKAETPLSNANAFNAIQESTDPAVESNVLILEAINRLRAELTQVIPSQRTPQAADSGDPDLTRLANLRSAQSIVERVVRGKRARAEDFVGTISWTTSSSYDVWVRNQLEIATGLREAGERDFVYDDEVLAATDPGYDDHDDFEPDEDIERGR